MLLLDDLRGRLGANQHFRTETLRPALDDFHKNVNELSMNRLDKVSLMFVGGMPESRTQRDIINAFTAHPRSLRV